MERRTVHYRGRVQGVGFRYTAQRIAAEHDVAGYVQNLADGRVRLVVEGSADELDRFLGAIRREMSNYIQDVEAVTAVASGEFDEFEIRH